MPVNDDEKIWAAYAKGVKPIGGGGKKKKQHPLAQKKQNKEITPSPAKTKDLLRKSRFSLPLPQGERRTNGAISPQASLDRNLERRLRRGEIKIDARLDLHGMRQDEAHKALGEFIDRQIKAGHRCLLIITGKGRGGEGVLRANLAGWLASSDHAAKILALRPAALKHGGAGAFYVMLKRQKGKE